MTDIEKLKIEKQASDLRASIASLKLQIAQLPQREESLREEIEKIPATKAMHEQQLHDQECRLLELEAQPTSG